MAEGRLAMSGNQDNFAVRAGLHDDFVRALRFGQRNLMANEGTKRFVFEASDKGCVDADEILLRYVPERHANDRSIAAHGVARIDFDRASVSDDHHAATERENRKIFGEIHVCEHFDNDVIASSVGKREGLFKMVWSAVIKHLTCALFGHEFSATFRTGGANDVQSGSPCQLDRCDSHAAAGALNQCGFRGKSLCLLEKSAICSPVRHVHRGPFRERGIRWKRKYCPSLAEGLFRVGSADTSRRINTHARSKPFNSAAYRKDRACDVGSGRVGKRRLAGIGAGAHVNFRWIHARRFDLYYNLAGTSFWIRNFLELQFFLAAECFHADRLHECFPTYSVLGHWMYATVLRTAKKIYAWLRSQI